VTKENQINTLAFQGDWDALLTILRKEPRLVNLLSESKGYTPLHQAAWHGASMEVIGALLSLGADSRTRTMDKKQTPWELAIKKYPDRADLVYALSERKLTIAQLMRKVTASTPDLFHPYDGNQILADRLIVSFGTDPCPGTIDKLTKRVENTFKALTGVKISSSKKIAFSPAPGYEFQADTEFWESRFLPILREYAAHSDTTFIEKEWAVVSDLFDPAPDQWGLRGDLFLWMEMRQALCLVPVPEKLSDLADIVSSAFHALTGKPLRSGNEILINRFSRGGMSSGMVDSSFWVDRFIPLLENRLKWLKEMWASAITTN